MTSLPIYSFFVVFTAIMVPGALYLFLARKVKKNIHDIADFFPLKRQISSNEYRSTTVAAGMSLATVIVAFINLAPFLGLTLMVSVISYSASFLLLYPCIGKILELNRENDTIQTFLGKAYKSSLVRYAALTFSIIGYISIFCMELIVGVTVLEPFLGNKVLLFALLYLVFILIYAWEGGYKAIIATDKWQLRFIIGSIFALLIFTAIQFSEIPTNIRPVELIKSSLNFPPVWAFIVGITVMNLPAPISDAGTWQRLCSTRSVSEARKGLLQVVPLFAVLWALLVLVGVIYTPIAQQLHNFDPTQKALMSLIIEQLSTNGPLMLFLLFIFFLGLFSAMISTADSLLIVASQLLTIDFLKIRASKEKDSSNLKKAKISMAILTCISFAIFSLFYLIKFDVVQLVFSIYGANLAMFPAVFICLFFGDKIDLGKAKWAAVASICFGFISGWGSAIYGKLSGNLNWLYNAPVSALVASLLIFLFVYMVTQTRRE